MNGNGNRNALRKFLGPMALTALSGTVLAAIAKICGAASGQTWLAFKWGAFIGFMILAIRHLIDGVAVPMVRTQLKREDRRRQREIEALGRQESNRQYLSDRLKQLN